MGSNKQVRPCRLQLEVPAQDLVQRWVRVRFGRYLPPTAVQSSAQALHLGLELVSAKLSPYLTEASLLECLQWALEAALQCAGASKKLVDHVHQQLPKAYASVMCQRPRTLVVLLDNLMPSLLDAIAPGQTQHYLAFRYFAIPMLLDLARLAGHGNKFAEHAAWLAARVRAATEDLALQAYKIISSLDVASLVTASAVVANLATAAGLPHASSAASSPLKLAGSSHLGHAAVAHGLPLFLPALVPSPPAKICKEGKSAGLVSVARNGLLGLILGSTPAISVMGSPLLGSLCVSLGLIAAPCAPAWSGPAAACCIAAPAFVAACHWMRAEQAEQPRPLARLA